jgi:hypothetical protein
VNPGPVVADHYSVRIAERRLETIGERITFSILVSSAARAVRDSRFGRQINVRAPNRDVAKRRVRCATTPDLDRRTRIMPGSEATRSAFAAIFMGSTPMNPRGMWIALASARRIPTHLEFFISGA